jgi:hypothetical protein
MAIAFNTEEELRRNVPAYKLVAVTPSNDTELDEVRALYVGTSGNLAVIAEGDTVAVTLVNVAAGSIIPVRAKKVMSTNTNASNIVAFK